MNLDLMLLINKQFLDTPFYGVQQLTWHLQNEGHAVNAKRIWRLMRLIRVGRENSVQHCFLTLLRTDLPEAEHQKACQGPQDLPLSARRTADRPAQSGLVRRHCLSADGKGLPLSGGHHGLVHPQGAGLAHLQHAGGRVLPRGFERSGPQVRPAGDHEYRWVPSSHPSTGPTA